MLPNDAMPLQWPLDLEHFHILLSLVCSSQLLKIRHAAPDDDGTEDIILDNDDDEELIQGGGNSGEAGTSMGPVVKT